MARYKPVDRCLKFIPVVLDAQIQPGSFEYALDYLVDNELDLATLHARYNNDATGAPAYDPVGQHLYSNGNHCVANGRTHHKFTGAQGACGPCKLRNQCLRHNKRLDHFTLRTQAKVNTQWTFYCLVNNIEKLAKAGFAQ